MRTRAYTSHCARCNEKYTEQIAVWGGIPNAYCPKCRKIMPTYETCLRHFAAQEGYTLDQLTDEAQYKTLLA